MGRLLLFNRRIHFSPDDLYAPALVAVLLRSGWLSIVVLMWLAVRNDCTFSWLVHMYLFVYLILLSTILLVDAIIALLSMSGSVSREGPRKYIGIFCHVEVMLSILDLGWQVFGLYAAIGPPYYDTQSCPKIPETFNLILTKMVMIWSLINSTSFLGTVLVFMGFTRRRNRRGNDFQEYLKLWQRRIEWFFSGPHSRSHKSKQVVLDVSREFADYFKDINWSPSDIAVGLLLLKREQKIAREAMEVKKLIPANVLLRTRAPNPDHTPLNIVPSNPPVLSRSGQQSSYLDSPRRSSISAVNQRRQMAIALAISETPKLKETELQSSNIASATSDPLSVTRIPSITVSPSDDGFSSKSPRSDVIVAIEPTKEKGDVPELSEEIDEKHESVSISSTEDKEYGANASQTSLSLPPNELLANATFHISLLSLQEGGNVHRLDSQASDVSQKAVSFDIMRSKKVGDNVVIEIPTSETDDPGKADMTTKGSRGKLEIYKRNISGSRSAEDLSVSQNKKKNRKLPMLKMSGRRQSTAVVLREESKRSMDRPRRGTHFWRAGGLLSASSGAPANDTEGPRALSFITYFWSTRRRKQRANSIMSTRSSRFSVFDLQVDPGSQFSRADMSDILHFAHYAEMAYINFNSVSHKKIDLLIHFNPKNDIFASPYLVSFDHDWQTIVIAIRGTYSTADMLVDLKIDTTILDDPEDGGDPVYAHSGMLETAHNIVAELIEERVLAKHLNDPESEYVNYDVVICGHSMGAGVAALVSFLLRRNGYPFVRCYAYSPPGSLISANAVKEFQQFCVAVIAGDDFVPRLTRNSMDVLKADVDRLINSCQLPKYRIFGSVLTNLCRGPSRKTKRIINRWKHKGRLQKDPFDHITQKELLSVQKTTGSIPRTWRGGVIQDSTPDGNVKLTGPPMFIPGRIVYLEKLRGYGVSPYAQESSATRKSGDEDREAEQRTDRPFEAISNFGKQSLQKMKQAVTEGIQQARARVKDYKYVYIPRWATQDEFQEIIVSRTMVSDHLSFGMLRELEDLPPEQPFLITS